MSNLLDALVNCGAVKFGDFTLKSGLKSTYYVDIKKASMNPVVLREITQAMSDKLDLLGFRTSDAPFDHETDIRYAGMELGAVPILVAASLKDDVPFLIVRKEPKDHGTMQRIEGDFYPGDAVVVLEDVTTTGGTSLDAVHQLRLANLNVRYVVSVVDRDQGAAEAFKGCGVKFTSLITAEELLAACPNKVENSGIHSTESASLTVSTP